MEKTLVWGRKWEHIFMAPESYVTALFGSIQRQKGPMVPKALSTHPTCCEQVPTTSFSSPSHARKNDNHE